jgi:hypothetical protein
VKSSPLLYEKHSKKPKKTPQKHSQIPKNALFFRSISIIFFQQSMPLIFLATLTLRVIFGSRQFPCAPNVFTGFLGCVLGDFWPFLGDFEAFFEILRLFLGY